MMKRILPIFVLLLCVVAATAQTTSSAPLPVDISGMYGFLQEGEFVQLTLNVPVLSGFISRYANQQHDSFVDQFFDKAEWNNGLLKFSTRKVQGTWYEFSGTVKQIPGKKPQQEGCLMMSGTLTTHTEADGKDKAEARSVEFASFAADDSDSTPKK